MENPASLISAYCVDAFEDSRVAWGSETEEEEIVDLPGLVQALGALGERFNFGYRINEAIFGGVVGKSFVFMEFEDRGGVAEIAPQALKALGLEFAE
jgi:hypothetical protein